MNEKPEIPLADLKRRFLDIRDAALDALKQIDNCEEIFMPQWRCSACFHVKQFVRPVALSSCGTCPKCGGEDFTPVWP